VAALADPAVIARATDVIAGAINHDRFPWA
jgi:hypothetical protein